MIGSLRPVVNHEGHIRATEGGRTGTDRWAASPSNCLNYFFPSPSSFCPGPGRDTLECCWSARSHWSGWSGCSGGRRARPCPARCWWSLVWIVCTGEFRCHRHRHWTESQAQNSFLRGYINNNFSWWMKGNVLLMEKTTHTQKEKRNIQAT